MNNTDYGHITPELLAQVTTVLEDAANHKYSVSRIYGTHNQVFKLQEKPESCASCLRKRASALKTWYGEYAMSQTDANVNPNQGSPFPSPYDTVEKIIEAWKVDTSEGEAQGLKALVALNATPANDRKVFFVELKAEELGLVEARINELEKPDLIELKTKTGEIVKASFKSEEGNTGELIGEDGKAVKPGTYTTGEGATYTVQPGGKATLKDDLL